MWLSVKSYEKRLKLNAWLYGIIFIFVTLGLLNFEMQSIENTDVNYVVSKNTERRVIEITKIDTVYDLSGNILYHVYFEDNQQKGYFETSKKLAVGDKLKADVNTIILSNSTLNYEVTRHIEYITCIGVYSNTDNMDDFSKDKEKYDRVAKFTIKLFKLIRCIVILSLLFCVYRIICKYIINKKLNKYLAEITVKEYSESKEVVVKGGTDNEL